MGDAGQWVKEPWRKGHRAVLKAFCSVRQPPDWEQGYSQAVLGEAGPPSQDVMCRQGQQTLRDTAPLLGRHSSLIGLLNGTELWAVFQIKPGVVFLHNPILSVLPLISQALAPCLCLAPPASPEAQPVWLLCDGAKCPSWNSSSLPNLGHKPTGCSAQGALHSIHSFGLSHSTSPSPGPVSGAPLAPAPLG